MSSEEEKSTRIFRVEKEIYAVNNTGEKKYTVVKKLEIDRYIKIIRYSEGYAYKGCVKEYSGTEIEGLFEGFIVGRFGKKKSRTMKYIKWGNNFRKKKSVYQNNNSHFYISPEEKEDGHKNYMYQAQENKHVKIIQSGLEKQEKKIKER